MRIGQNEERCLKVFRRCRHPRGYQTVIVDMARMAGGEVLGLPQEDIIWKKQVVSPPSGSKKER